jgi:hypothetical protein
MLKRLLVPLLVLSLAPVAANAAERVSVDPLRDILVIVTHDQSQGQVRLNGVPIYRFVTPKGTSGVPTTSISIALWAVNGENVVTVDSQPMDKDSKAVTSVSVMVNTGAMDDFDKPRLFEQEIEGSGTATYKIALEGVPRWAFNDSEKWSGSEAELLAAVQALHKAYAARDFAAIDAMQKAQDDDLRLIMGPIDKQIVESHEFVKTAKLAPLPKDLKVASYYDGRLFLVTDGDGGAPIRLMPGGNDKDASDPALAYETGSYWIRRDGKWLVVRDGG